MWPIIGHDRTVGYLKRSLEKNALSHAYLFTGPKHVGKMSLAVMLAQAVNCQGADRPCGECSSCLKIAARNHPDVQALNLLTADEAEDKKAKSEIIIDQVRDLQRRASLPPYEGYCRVFIFEQADLLNEAAANCLLKSLEEPLPNVLFILLAPNIGAVPETIASRCQCLALRSVPAAEIEEMLFGRGLTSDQASLMARLAGGAPGWALDALEHEEILSKRTERLERLLGITGQGYEERFEAAEEFVGKGGRAEVAEVIRDWQGLWRDLLLAQSGRVEDIINLDGKDKIVALGNRVDLADIRGFLSALIRAEELVGANVNPRLVLETLMLDMPLVDKARLKR